MNAVIVITAATSPAVAGRSARIVKTVPGPDAARPAYAVYPDAAAQDAVTAANARLAMPAHAVTKAQGDAMAWYATSAVSAVNAVHACACRTVH